MYASSSKFHSYRYQAHPLPQFSFQYPEPLMTSLSRRASHRQSHPSHDRGRPPRSHPELGQPESDFIQHQRKRSVDTTRSANFFTGKLLSFRERVAATLRQQSKDKNGGWHESQERQGQDFERATTPNGTLEGDGRRRRQKSLHSSHGPSSSLNNRRVVGESGIASASIEAAVEGKGATNSIQNVSTRSSPLKPGVRAVEPPKRDFQHRNLEHALFSEEELVYDDARFSVLGSEVNETVPDAYNRDRYQHFSIELAAKPEALKYIQNILNTVGEKDQEIEKLKEREQRLQDRINSRQDHKVNLALGEGTAGDSEIRDQWKQLEQRVYKLVKGMDRKKAIQCPFGPEGRHDGDARMQLKKVGITYSPRLLDICDDPAVAIDIVRAIIWVVLSDEVFNGDSGPHAWAGSAGEHAWNLEAELIELCGKKDRTFHRWRCHTATILQQSARPEDVVAKTDEVSEQIEEALRIWVAKPERFRNEVTGIVEFAISLDALLNRQPAWFVVDYPVPEKWSGATPHEIPFQPKYMRPDTNMGEGPVATLVIVPVLTKQGNARWEGYDDGAQPLEVDGMKEGAAIVRC